MAAGDFSASALLNIKAKAESMWADSRFAQDFKANAATAVAVKTNSTARFTELADREKDNIVKVTWLDPCAIAVADCTSDCDITGPEIESKSQDYALDLCKEVKFSVDAEKTRTNDYTVEEQAARGLANAIKALDEWWSVQALLKLKAFSGRNVHPEPWTYALGTTTVPAAEYNFGMVPHLQVDAIMNKLNNPYYLDNGSLFVDYQNAQYNSGNFDGKGDNARANALKLYFDMWNFAAAGITEDTFAVSSSALAFVTKNRHGIQPELIGGEIQQTRYSVPSSVIPGVRYDVFYKLKCVTVAGVEHIVHAWKLKTRGGIFLNPQSCPITIGGDTFTSTGVLSYTKGA